MGRITEFGRRYLDQFRRDDVPGLAAELAYRFLFAIFPFGIFVAALGAFVAGMAGVENPAGKIVSALGDNLPAELASTVQGQLEAVINQSRPSLLSFGALAALYAATGGTNALIKSMNRAYEVEETRGFVGRLALAVGLTLLAGVGLIASFVTIVGGTMLTEQVVEQLGLAPATWNVIALLRWPLVFGMLVVAVAILFRLAPNVVPPRRWILVGAALFAVAWLLVTFGFSLYVANFANYANTYGALGGVIALMLWFYLTSIVLVGAAEFVAVATEMTEPERLRERREELGIERAAKEAAKEAASAVAERARRLTAASARSGEGSDRRDATEPRPAVDGMRHRRRLEDRRRRAS